MGYSTKGMQQVTTTSSVPAATSTPYKAATSSVEYTTSPKQTALMKKTSRAVPAGYLKAKTN